MLGIISHQGNADKKQWHVIAVVTLDDGRCGVKVLPRVVPSIVHVVSLNSCNSARWYGILILWRGIQGPPVS